MDFAPRGTAASSPWLKELSQPAAAEVICFPHSGGAASTFRPLAAELAGDARVVAVQYPGRQERHAEPVITDLHELADQVTQALWQVPVTGPRIFLGHSMGAILAYETAQRLGPEGPHALFVSARPSPSRVPLTTRYLLPDDELVAHVALLGGTAARVLADSEMRELLLPVIRGDYQASETYRHRDAPPLSCQLIALAGDADPAASVADVSAWREHTTGPSRMVVLPGGHFYLYDHWRTVAQLIRSASEGESSRPRCARPGPPSWNRALPAQL
jgi:surfactin synthase thioesterase subunit